MNDNIEDNQSPIRDVSQSWELYDRATDIIPLATQTHAKAPRPALRGIEPCYIVRGDGCRVWDLDGNEYIDFRNSLGPITLGHHFPTVDRAVQDQLTQGTIFSYAHPLEVEVAERLVQLIPCAESVRFLRTGGEAMAATIRLARAFTGRDLVLMSGYHGWLNTVFSLGVPEAIRSVYRQLPWGNIEPYAEAFNRYPGEIAAVTVACDYENIDQGHSFLPQLRALTEEHGALLVFDEIVTGFRLSLSGAQGYFGVVPDLAVFAKGLANGYPLSTYLGRREVMQIVEKSVVSSTFGGDTISLAATKAVLDTYTNEDVIGTLWERGQQLHDGFSEICQRLEIPAGFYGLPPTGILLFTHQDNSRNDDLFQIFNAETLKRGVIIYNLCYPNYAHSPNDIDTALNAMKESLQSMKSSGLFD